MSSVFAPGFEPTAAQTSRLPADLLAMTAAVAFSMTGARPLDPAAPNDMDTYSDVYRELTAAGLKTLLTIGGDLKVALPLL